MNQSPPFDAWLASLSDEARAAVAKRHAELAFADGAYVLKPPRPSPSPDGATKGEPDQTRVAIPPIFFPVTFDEPVRARLSEDARTLLDTLDRVSEWLMTSSPDQVTLRDRLFSTFTPLERAGVDQTWRAAANLATARVDFLVDADGQPRALEMNSTIPAMQGYSDGIAAGFVRAVGEARGKTSAQIDGLIEQNGRNTDQLLASLLAHYERLGGRATSLRIAIVARAHDAQLGELEHYQRRWTALGHDVQIVQPDELTRGEHGPEFKSQSVDLIYRHIFARRLDLDSAFAQMLLAPEANRIFNPMSTHLECKAMLALASGAAEGEGPAAALRLSEHDIATIRRCVPWSRVLAPLPSHAPDGTHTDDLVAYVTAHADEFVLKRSWDYGGRGVFLGADIDTDATQTRLRALMSRDGAITWRDLVDYAVTDQELWIAQALVRAVPTTMALFADGSWQEHSFYADVSAYTNRGVATMPTGGAVRASGSRIVNIAGGGGVAPLLHSGVLRDLLTST